MYQKLQSSSSSSSQKDTARTLYIEIVRNSGTSPSVMFLKQMIEQDQMSEIEKFLVVSTFSHYIKTPTEDLIHQIFHLIKSNAVTSKPYLKAPAQMVFATLIRQACFNSRNKVYPENMFGKMCSPNHQKITEEYIPYLVQQLAVSTWFEQDHEVARYVYSSLKSYAQLQPEDHPEESSLRQLSQQCQSVLKLAKPMSQIISVHQVHSGYLPELQIGATMVNSLIKGMSSTELYHKTEYYLKQAQTVPMEFAGHVSGLNTVYKSILKSLGKHQGINQELKKILSQLEVSPRTDSQFEAGAWLRLSDDINFAVEFNEGHINVMKEKVLKAIKESGFSVMQKVCGKHSINHNNVFEELPYQALVPSDMGLPIIVESQMTYLVSLKGEVNLECSFSQ